MSSATSIDDGVTPKTEIKKEAPGAFSPWHFFVLLSLVTASDRIYPDEVLQLLRASIRL